MKFLFFSLTLVLLAAQPVPATEATPSAFGNRQRSESALIGILYDLKQTQKREPKTADFQKLIGEFVRKDWDEGLLNNYYRATRPLYTTQVFIPLSSAEDAPRAFEVADLMKPRQWVVHYKGQVRPPLPGTYRFVGLSDDLLAAAVNGKTVFIGEHPGSRLVNHGWREAERNGIQTPSGEAIAGDWFTVAADETIDLDVLVGERPGGRFGAWLLIEREGDTYDRDKNGKSILPVFQLTEAPIPSGRSPEARAARADEIWFGVQ